MDPAQPELERKLAHMVMGTMDAVWKHRFGMQQKLMTGIPPHQSRYDDRSSVDGLVSRFIEQNLLRTHSLIDSNDYHASKAFHIPQ